MTFVSPFVCVSLRIAIRADHPQVFHIVVIRVTIYMVESERDRLTSPLNITANRTPMSMLFNKVSPES